jgi:hypothetical protein
MQNIPSGLIPYNHEKYLTGKYIAETRGGFRPPEIFFVKGSRRPVVFASSDSKTIDVFPDGYTGYLNNNENDLYLRPIRPKTVKKWHPVLNIWLFDSMEDCVKEWKDGTAFLKAVEVEVTEE